MARVLITGAAGFIGSHTVEEAVRCGVEVRAIDNFNDYYDPNLKLRNAELVRRNAGVEVGCVDLSSDDLSDLVAGVDSIIHLAGQPGVRTSWEHFESYLRNNLLATNRLLESCVRRGVNRFVLASSSSVYGNALSYPVAEDARAEPVSPYGVSKLAAEHLVRSYTSNFEIESICLRYFTVFGPRQRPDMAFARLIESSLRGQVFSMFGDGSQVRDFTYVKDVARANLLSVFRAIDRHATINVSGSSSSSMKEVVDIIAEITGEQPRIQFDNPSKGDVKATGGAIDMAKSLLGWEPEVDLRTGISLQVAESRLSDRRSG